MTGLLVRSTATNWARGSLLAVDAGVHLAAITRCLTTHVGSQISDPTHSPLPHRNGTPSRSSSRPAGPSRRSTATSVSTSRPPLNRRQTLEESASHVPHQIQTTGPFQSLPLPYTSPAANAAHITRHLISTYLITHPHLDHISAFVINTASFQHTSRPKRLAALPSTIDALKTHIFNDLIWPNLSDEEGGVGLVSYMRLAEGGNVAIGEGGGRGYIEVCEGLGVKSWAVSHGHCMKGNSTTTTTTTTSGSHEHTRRISTPGHDTTANGSSSSHRRSLSHVYHDKRAQVYDSTAFFIRDSATGKEVLIFGDVEPDTISLTPRTAQVWNDAAEKIVAGLLTGLFIECSYDDSQSDETLFGHLAPRHLIDELTYLAGAVIRVRSRLEAEAIEEAAREQEEKYLFASGITGPASMLGRKRKRESLNGFPTLSTLSGPNSGSPPSGINADFPRGSRPRNHSHVITPSAGINATTSAVRTASVSSTTTTTPTTTGTTPTATTTRNRRGRSRSTNVPHVIEAEEDENHDPADDIAATAADVRPVGEGGEESLEGALTGLRVVIIHMKDTLRDGPPIGVPILQQLKEYEEETGLGCEFVISQAGVDLWL